MIAALAAFVLLLQGSSSPASPCDATPLLIRNATVWTARGPQAGQDVLIRDGRVAVIEAAGSRKHEGVRILDGTGQTLLPGLVDAHLHFTIPGGLPRTGAPRTDVAHLTARQLLRSGVTSGRLHLASLEDAASLKARSHPRQVERSALDVAAMEDEVSAAAGLEPADIGGSQHTRRPLGRRHERVARGHAHRPPRLELPPDRAGLEVERGARVGSDGQGDAERAQLPELLRQRREPAFGARELVAEQILPGRRQQLAVGKGGVLFISNGRWLAP